MKIRCNKCREMQEDTMFQIRMVFGVPIGLSSVCDICKNPEAYNKARKQIEEYFGKFKK